MASRLVTRSMMKQLAKVSTVQSNLIVKQFSPMTAAPVHRQFSVSAASLQEKSSSTFQELSAFLSKEIQLEKEQHPVSALPKITGFEVKADGPNVTLTRAHDTDEQITVTFNVNGSLDNSEEPQVEELDAAKQPEATEPEQSTMKSKPHFSVDLKRGDEVLSFGCSFLSTEGEKDAAEDFQIDELAIHSGDWNENVYTADCSVFDGQLYDILLNLLDERGVGETFANELAEFSSVYEQSQYVSLLERLQKFSK
jgi:hypothetical protein